MSFGVNNKMLHFVQLAGWGHVTYLTRQQRTSFSVSVSTSTLTTTSTAATDNYASQCIDMIKHGGRGGRGERAHKGMPEVFFFVYLLIIFVSEEPSHLGPTEASAPPTFHPSMLPNTKNTVGRIFHVRCVPNLSKPKKHVPWMCFLDLLPPLRCRTSQTRPQ